jgi:hypothetical protein
MMLASRGVSKLQRGQAFEHPMHCEVGSYAAVDCVEGGVGNVYLGGYKLLGAIPPKKLRQLTDS